MEATTSGRLLQVATTNSGYYFDGTPFQALLVLIVLLLICQCLNSLQLQELPYDPLDEVEKGNLPTVRAALVSKYGETRANQIIKSRNGGVTIAKLAGGGLIRVELLLSMTLRTIHGLNVHGMVMDSQ